MPHSPNTARRGGVGRAARARGAPSGRLLGDGVGVRGAGADERLPAVGLRGTPGGDEHGGAGGEPAETADDVAELPEAEVACEARFRDHVIAELQRHAVRQDGIRGVRDIAERTRVHQHRLPFARLHEVRLERVLHDDGHRAAGLQVELGGELPQFAEQPETGAAEMLGVIGAIVIQTRSEPAPAPMSARTPTHAQAVAMPPIASPLPFSRVLGIRASAMMPRTIPTGIAPTAPNTSARPEHAITPAATGRAFKKRPTINRSSL